MKYALLLLVAACGDDAIAPVITTRGDVRVIVRAVPASIEIDRGDRVVWRTGDQMSEFRTADASAQMLLGSFKIEDEKVADAPWTVVSELSELEATDRGARFTLRADGRDVGSGTVSLDGEHAEIALRFTDGDRASLSSRCDPSEHFLGLGGQSWDVDHHGQTVPLWVQEDGIGKTEQADDDWDGVWFLTGRRHSTHSPIPMLVSSGGYGLALATDTRAVFALCSEDPEVARYEAWSRELDLHVFVGDLPHAVDQMTAWVGRPDPPPRVIFAPWMDAIFGSTNVRRVADAARAAGIAASVIWTEDWRGGMDSGTGYALDEDWHFDPAIYPDFAQLATDLHANGFLFLTYNNTFADSAADIYQEAIDGGYTIHHGDGTPYNFMGVTFHDSTLLDLSNPAAVAWAKDVYRVGLDLGADGWMADYGEWLPTDATLASGEDALAVHNRYARDWAQLNHDLAVERRAAGKPFLYFMRSAWLGSQPLVQVFWPGDQQTDFSLGDGFPSVIPMAIGLGVTGFPYFGSDLGGYMSQTTAPTSKELWFRWCALAALSPVMRTHHGRSAREDWSWEKDAETTALFRRWTRFHMQLVPYFESLSAEARAHGAPMIRPIAWTYPDAGDWAWKTTDEYLLGDVLVAPVIVEGAVARTVTLPSGSWYPLLGGAAVSGGDQTVAAPLGEIPAFVPGGTIIPAWPDGVTTVIGPNATDPIDRELWIWPGDPSAAPRSRCEGDGTTCYAWTPRSGEVGAPIAATWNGAPITLAQDGGTTIAQVQGTGTLVFAGGGTLVTTGGAPNRTLRVLLRIQ
ncbi:MAG TPA: TIM-barrel domain-containing protein [Kofleriaceae bacterium]|nr:TIM-barrel domain-containing protein [Kofleriaceae bacterium]